MSDLLILKLREFAELLGWRGLQACTVDLDGREITWFETTDKKFYLQINPQPVGSRNHFRATVIATRYGLPLDAVGFHDFDLQDEKMSLKVSSEDLYPILGRRNFKNKPWRNHLLHQYAKRMAEHGHNIGWPSQLPNSSAPAPNPPKP